MNSENKDFGIFGTKVKMEKWWLVVENWTAKDVANYFNCVCSDHLWVVVGNLGTQFDRLPFLCFYRFVISGFHVWSIIHFCHPSQQLERWEFECTFWLMIYLGTCMQHVSEIAFSMYNPNLIFPHLVSRNGWLLKFFATNPQMRSKLFFI